MNSIRTVTTVETHTEGMPTRVVTSGIGEIPGATMFDKRLHFMEHMDYFRQWLMYEPRGHSAMSGAILQKPTRADADWGVVYIEVSGCLPMCGHGTIGVATALVEKKLVKVVEPVTTPSWPVIELNPRNAVITRRSESATFEDFCAMAAAFL